jgi:hypothetical protein
VSNGSSVTTKTITNNVNQHSASTQSQDTASTTSVNTASATSMNTASVSTANIGPSMSSVVVPGMGQQATQSGSVGPSINSGADSCVQNPVPGGSMSNVDCFDTAQQSGGVGPSVVTSSVNIPVATTHSVPGTCHVAAGNIDPNSVYAMFQPSGSSGAGHVMPGSANHGYVMPDSVLQSSGSVGPSYFVPGTGHLATVPNYSLQPTSMVHSGGINNGSGLVPGDDINATIRQLLTLLGQSNVTNVLGPSVQHPVQANVQAPLHAQAGDPGLQSIAGTQQGLHSIQQGPHSVPGFTESRTGICAPHGIAQKTAEQAVSGVYVDLSEFLPPLAAGNFINRTELEPFLDGRDNLSYRPKRTKRRINNFDNWLEAWAHYEKLVIKYVGVCCHEAFVDYRLFMTECNRKYNWYCVAMYDFKHRVSLAAASTLAGRFAFSTVDMNLFPTILDSTAIRPNAPRCPRCRGYDHVAAKECPFPEGGGGGKSVTQRASKTSKTQGKQNEICHNFNRDSCLLGQACVRKHVCRTCGGPKPLSLCSVSGPCAGKG